MKTIETDKGTLIFNSNFYVIVSNNGNHTGHNRIWTLWAYGYDMKIAALNDLRKEISNNSDMKFGLTFSKIVTPEELCEIINSDEVVKYLNCFDIS